MFDHVTIRVSDRGESQRFYTTVLRALEVEPTHDGERFVEWNDFSVAPATAERPVTRRLHVAFFAPSRAHVDAFWRAGVDAGYRDDGEPGPRPQYSEDYYGGFLLDPDGNSAEAVHHGADRRAGQVDHLWIRVGDRAAVKEFFETIAAFTGFELRNHLEGRTHFADGTASFAIVDGEPTEHVHVAFTAPDDATVDAFHRTATAAGYRDEGAPGERAVYHPGYYAAYVLDPEGNNDEVENHNRA